MAKPRRKQYKRGLKQARRDQRKRYYLKVQRSERRLERWQCSPPDDSVTPAITKKGA